jgi:hypothetical protein
MLRLIAILILVLLTGSIVIPAWWEFSKSWSAGQDASQHYHER